MINVIFIYKERKVFIQCNLEDKMRNICEKFAVKADIKVDSKIYLYNNKPLSINPELNKTFGQQIDSKDIGDKEITVLDHPDKEYTVKLHYEGRVKEVKIKQDVKYGSLFDQIGNYFSLKAKSFYTLCNGVLVGDDDENLGKSISQLSNKMNQEMNEINLIIEENDSFLSEDKSINCDNQDMQNSPKVDEKKAQEILINERKKVAKFLLKIYVKLLVQHSLIGFFLYLGFDKNYNEIFIKDDSSITLTFIFEGFFITYIGLLLLRYKKNKCHCCTIFHIIIFIPFIISLCFLLSYNMDKNEILLFVLLIIIDFISVIFFLLIKKRNIGYGILFLCLAINVIYICSLYIFYYKSNFTTIYGVFSCASAAIFYILFFNNIAKKKFDENEGIAAVFFFNYSFFLLISIPLCITFVSIILIPLCLLLVLLVFSMITFFGAGFIVLFLIIKVFYSLYCKSKKNKINKYIKIL